MKNKKLPLLLIGAFSFLYVTFLVFAPLSMGQNSKEYKDSKRYKELMEEKGAYGKITGYLGTERKTTQESKLLPTDFILLTVIDTCLSLFCLWLTILILLKRKELIIKEYLWFLGIFNFAWLICLFLFKALWQLLVILILKSNPELQVSVVDSFSFFMLAGAVSIYIWLLARTFKLNFFGTLGTTLIFHAIYFLLITGLCFVAPKNNKLFHLIEKNLGMKPVVQSYLLDVKKITTQRNLLSYIRFRPFHL